jgi:hypothetical protein
MKLLRLKHHLSSKEPLFIIRTISGLPTGFDRHFALHQERTK